MRKCKFPDEECTDRYMSHSRGYLCCRLDEWKRKIGVCPYDPSIQSKQKAKTLPKEQMKLI